VSLLGAGPVEWFQSVEGLRIKMPTEKPCEYAFAFKIQCNALS
jgi:hypothetical protein